MFKRIADFLRFGRGKSAQGSVIFQTIKEESRSIPVRIPFRYHWMNLRTKARGVKVINCNDRESFVECLARWNRTDPDWKYWEVVDN